MKRAAIWTKAHQREAGVRTYELAGELEREGHNNGLAYSLACCTGTREDEFRSALRAAGFDPARISREVRRVDALATGRLVRSQWWRPFGSDQRMTEADAAERRAVGWRIVRETRISIRRAP